MVTLQAIVDTYADRFKHNFNAIRVNQNTQTVFTNENPATNPLRGVDDPLVFCNLVEIKSILKKVPNKTSSGLDNIPMIVLKHLPDRVIIALAIIFNNSINHYYFAKDWNCAKVLPILKNGKPPDEPASYRPISLTSNVSKIYEMVVNIRIVNFSTEQNIIPDNQYGFKQQHSTTHAINKLLSDINTNIHYGKLVGAALIDLEKAFDSVWLNGLLYKLHNFRFPQWLIYLIWDMISNKKFVTWDGSETSTVTFNISEGLQQGTVNSPVLFNIFTSSVINLFDLNTDNSNASSIAYADDLIVYIHGTRPTTIQNDLEQLVEKINHYYMTWNLRINPDKCETILFRKPVYYLSKDKREGWRNFHISTTLPGTNDKVRIPHRQVVKYLGVYLDHLLRGNIHLTIQRQKALAAFHANSRIFYNVHLTKRAKIILYLLLIRPIISYAAPIWWNSNVSAMEQLRAFERSCLRACLRLYRSTHSNYNHYVSNKTLYNTANVPRIDSFCVKLTRDYYSKLRTIRNAHINNLAIIDERTVSSQALSGYLTPQSFIYFDSRGIIQNSDNIPIIYHWRRNKANKRITITENDWLINRAGFSESTTISKMDFFDFHRLNVDKYWWLSRDSPVLIELARRRPHNAANRVLNRAIRR